MIGCISKHPDSDRCPICNEKLDHFASEQAKWPVGIFTKDNIGVLTYYHHGCAGKAIEEYIDQKQLKLLTKWI